MIIASDFLQMLTKVFVKQNIQNLRTAFRKELKKLEDSKRSGQGTGGVYVPRQWYFDLLMFTTDDVTPRPSLETRKRVEQTVEELHEPGVNDDDNSEISAELDDSTATPLEQRPETTEPGTSQSSLQVRKMVYLIILFTYIFVILMKQK